MSEVRDYCDANTWKWLPSGTDPALGREPWGPGAADLTGFLEYDELALARP